MDMRKVSPSAKLIYTLPQHWQVLKAKAFRGNEIQMVSLMNMLLAYQATKEYLFLMEINAFMIQLTAKQITETLGTWKQCNQSSYDKGCSSALQLPRFNNLAFISEVDHVEHYQI